MWGKIRQDFRKFLPKQSMQNILYVIILTLTLLVAVFVGFFVSKSQQEKQAQIIVQDNQELAEQINVSMSQYLHSMMRLSDTLYYNIIKGNDRGQMEQMFQAMYDGYKDYVESIALFQEDGTLLQVMPALSSAASSDVMQEEWFSSALERSENIHFFRPQIQDCFEHNSSFPWVIPMSRFVQITHGNQVLSGVLLINIKYSALSEVFRNSTDDMNQYSFLMDLCHSCPHIFCFCICHGLDQDRISASDHPVADLYHFCMFSVHKSDLPNVSKADQNRIPSLTYVRLDFTVPVFHISQNNIPDQNTSAHHWLP